jgi:hypothetical protein
MNLYHSPDLQIQYSSSHFYHIMVPTIKIQMICILVHMLFTNCSATVSHFVLIVQNTWLPWAILVFEWLNFRKCSTLWNYNYKCFVTRYNSDIKHHTKPSQETIFQKYSKYKNCPWSSNYDRIRNPYYKHEYIIWINIMVIVNIEMTTQYKQDKTAQSNNYA